MKKALVILSVIAFVAALSSAAVYTPTLDTFLRYDNGVATTPQALGGSYSGAQSQTYGGQAQQRAGKAYQDQFMMAFDRAAILADAATQLGRPATANDFINGTLTMTLSLMSNGGGFNHTAMYAPAYFTSTGAATRENHIAYNFADGDENAGTAGEYVLWNNGVNDSALGNAPRNSGVVTYTVQDCPHYIGTPIMWSAADFFYQDFAYSGTMAAGYLFSPLNAYLEPYGDYSNNGFVNAKEGKWADGTTYGGPKLTIVPEPMTLSLLAAGALALLRRRK